MAWINPRYRELTGQDPPSPDRATDDQREAPQETGRRLATFDRTKRGGPHQELRVGLDSYEGHPYVSVRLWIHDPRSNRFLPTKAGHTIRVREIGDMIEALRSAERLADAPAPAGPSPKRPAARKPSRGQQDFPPERAAGGENFTEF